MENITESNKIKLEEHFGELLPRLPFKTISFYESSNSWEGQIEYNLNFETGELTYNTIENIKHLLDISPDIMQRIESEVILMLENM